MTLMLGQLIQRVLKAQDLFLDQIGVTDLVLMARINQAAEDTGQTPQSFVAGAIHRLLNSDDDGTWATLMGKLQNSDTPGLAFIDMAVRKHLDDPPARLPPQHPPSVQGTAPPAPSQARPQGGGCGSGGCGCNG